MKKILLTTDWAHDVQTVIFFGFYWNYFFDILLFKLKICNNEPTVYA
jgi:hypothetical protein